jgi:hypothetical protein
MQTLSFSGTKQADLFQQLQTQLRERWQTIEQFDRGDYDILVVPSLSLDQRELQKVQGADHYEERHLFFFNPSAESADAADLRHVATAAPQRD